MTKSRKKTAKRLRIGVMDENIRLKELAKKVSLKDILKFKDK